MTNYSHNKQASPVAEADVGDCSIVLLLLLLLSLVAVVCCQDKAVNRRTRLVVCVDASLRTRDITPSAFYYARQTAIARLSHRNSVRPSVCHTGGSGKNGAS